MANKFFVSTSFDYFVKNEKILDLLKHQSIGRIVIKIKFSIQILYQEFIEVKEAVKMLNYVSISLKLVSL